MKHLPGPRIAWALAASLLSALLLRLSFPVPGWFPLAWVALAPWFVLLRVGSRREALVGSAAMGLAAAALCLSWQYIVTVPGGIGLSIYVGLYFVLFGLVARAVVGRFRVPLVLAAPVLWVACEFLRSFLFTGFPWMFLGHTQFPFKPLIQVSDLFGAYAVSFILAASNAALAEAALAWWRREGRWRQVALGAAFAGALAGAALAYGAWRLAALEPREGPVIGIVQGNVPQEIKNRLTLETVEKIFAEHRELTLELAARAEGQKLGLVVWPETMVQLPLNREEYPVIRQFRHAIADIARLLRCPLLVGAHAEVGVDLDIKAEADDTARMVTDGEITTEHRAYLLPHYADPDTGQKPIRRIHVREGQAVRRGDILASYESLVFNSAYLFRPGAMPGRADRYDKTHPVPFGEYIPLPSLLGFLKKVVPMGKGFSAGDRLNLLEVDGARFGILICFESAFPGISRGYVARADGPGADFLINISNDGWFKGSHELDQHLAICGFRAVECRIGIVRSVNSGISAIIDPAGRVGSVVTDARGRRKLVSGIAIGRVYLRQRLSFYALHGDLFAGGCSVLSALALLAAPLRRKPMA